MINLRLKKVVNKIKRTKLVLKLILALLVFTTMTGFVFNFVTAKEDNRSTKLIFNAIEIYKLSPPGWIHVPDPFTFYEGNMMHTKDFWSYHVLSEATIGEEPIMGYTFAIFHQKVNMVTGNAVLNGQVLFNFTWSSTIEMKGYFTGTINAKVINGVLSGKFTLQGFEDFEGMADYFKELEALGADALIIADPGVLTVAKEAVPNMEPSHYEKVPDNILDKVLGRKDE